jgi:hypothetical protein
LSASSLCFLSSVSCFLDLSFAFGDLSPMVIASGRLRRGMLRQTLGQVHGNHGRDDVELGECSRVEARWQPAS